MSRSILFVDHDEGRSGSTVSLEFLIKAFVRKGYTVFVLTPKEGTAIASLVSAGATTVRLRDYHVSTINLGFHFTNIRSLLSWKGLRTFVNNVVKFILGIVIVSRVIRKTRADLVYINEHVVAQAAVAARLCGIPSVAHIRSPFVVGDFGIRRWIASRLLLRFNAALFPITERDAAQLNTRNDERRKVTVIGEFFQHVGAAPPAQTFRKTLSGDVASLRIVAMLGGVQAIKGTEDFLTAAKLVLARRGDVLFVVAGKIDRAEAPGRREYYDQCERLLATIAPRNRVLIAGELPLPEQLIADADIVVSPSTESHFSRPVIEAWAFGKPVVATRTDHMQSLITDRVNGLLVDIGDPEQLASSIQGLLDDSGLCKKLGEAGKLKATADFDADANTGRIVEKCEAVLAQP